MDFLLTFKNAFKKLRYRRLFSFLFIVNLSLALFSFLWVATLKTSTESYVSLYKKTILGGDLYLRKYKPFDEEISSLEKLMPKDFTISKGVSLVGMSRHEKEAKLSAIRFIDDHYPLYGDLILSDEEGNLKKLSESKDLREEIKNAPSLLIDEKLSIFLKARIGDEVQVGETKLKVAYIVSRDLSVNIGRDATVPRLYLHLNKLDETKLYQPGARINFLQVYRFADKNLNTKNLVTKLNAFIEKNYLNEAVYAQSDEEYAENSLTVLSYIADYLTLIALTNLFLSGICAFYLFNSHIRSSLKEYAVSLTLSPKKSLTLFSAISELFLLCSFALVLSLVFYALVEALSRSYFKDVLPRDFNLSLTTKTFLLSLFIAFVNPPLFCSLALYKIAKLRVIDLLKNNFEMKIPKKLYILFFGAPLFVYYGLYLYASSSVKTASVFFFVLLGSIAIAYAVGLGLLFLVGKIMNRLSFPFSLVFVNIKRNQAYVLSIFLTLSLITSLTTFIPQAQSSINLQIQNPNASLPSLFLFDIKKDSVDLLKDIVEKEGTEIKNLTPMLFAKLVSINDVALKDWKKIPKNQEKRAQRLFRNRDINFTYHNELNHSESIVEGKPLSATSYDETNDAELSITKDVAQMLGLKIGDKLLVNVESMDVSAVVKNVRDVKWNEFVPNFFFVFQEGIFEDYPQTFLAYVPQTPDLKKRIRLQESIISQISSISILDVEEIIGDSMKNVKIIYLLSIVMASFSIVCGFLIFLSIVAEQVMKRRLEINLLKVLSPSQQKVSFIFIAEFFFISFFSCLLGVLLSALINALVFHFIFENKWTFSPEILLISLFASLAATLLVSILATQRTLKEKTIVLLKENL